MVQLSGFIDIGQILDFLKLKRWDGETEIEELVAVARQDENLGAKVTAIKYLRSLLYDALQAAGLMVKATRSLHGEDGSTITFTTDLISAALQQRKRQEKLKGETDAPDNTKDTKKDVPRQTGTSVNKPPNKDSRHLLPGIAITPASPGEVSS